MKFLLRIYWVLLAGSLVLSAQDKRPNVLFIAVDDMNHWISPLRNYPGIQTPNLERLAAKGVTFANAYCAAPACAPSRAAVVLGMYPSSTGLYINPHDFRPYKKANQIVTLPDMFKQQGYKTLGGGKIYHSYSFNPRALKGQMDSEPWDDFFPAKDQQLVTEVTPETWPVNSEKKFYGGRFDWAPLQVSDDEMGDGQVVQWAEGQLGKEHEKPLFLAVGIYRPHVPWWTPQAYFDLYQLDELVLPEVADRDLDDIPEAGRKFARRPWQQWMLDNHQWKKAVQGYLASTTFADALIGRLLDALESGPLADNTIIVLWGDHGYHLGHKEHWEKFALWEQSTHVPLFIADPRHGKPGTVTRQPVSLVDLFPTLAELCGLTPPGQLEGESLLPLIKDPDLTTGRGVVTTERFNNHAVRTEHWRYIRYADGSEELYNHQNDPHEFTNLATRSEFDSVKSYLATMLPKSNTPAFQKNPEPEKH